MTGAPGAEQGPRIRAGFAEATAWFLDVVAHAPGHWDEPGLGEWTVRDLAGHTSRSLLTTEAYVQPAAGEAAGEPELGSPAEYFRRAAASLADPAAVARRGRDAGAALGADPVAALGGIAARVLEGLARTADDAVARTPVGTMRLLDYLPTRTVELTVHTCDLARALGRPLQVPPLAGEQSLALVAALAAGTGRAGPLLLAATGRTPLPPGFTVL